MRYLLSSIVALSLICGAVLPSTAADCQTALATVFGHEGGYQNIRNDSGNWTGGKVGKGVQKGTKYGIAAASYPKVDIKNLTLKTAALYYERDYWNPLNLSLLKSQGLATTIFDTSVNCGTGASAILFARTRNIVSGKSVDAPVDPVITREDAAWANDYTRPKHRRVMFYLVFQALRSERYAAIARADRRKAQFLPVWLVRTWGQ